MTSIPPIIASTNPATGAGSAGSSTPPNLSNSNGLGPNAFITLLTAQLQSQDPLNPMDPNQMVNELTSMNTLQQIIQIRQDLDSLARAAQAGSNSASGAAPGNSGTSSLTTAAALNSVTGLALPGLTAANSPTLLYSQAIHKPQFN